MRNRGAEKGRMEETSTKENKSILIALLIVSLETHVQLNTIRKS